MLLDAETLGYLKLHAQGRLPAELDREIREVAAPEVVAAGAVYCSARRAVSDFAIDRTVDFIAVLRR